MEKQEKLRDLSSVASNLVSWNWSLMQNVHEQEKFSLDMRHVYTIKLEYSDISSASVSITVSISQVLASSFFLGLQY